MAGKANISKQIFISYSRVDVDFARILTAELATLGFTLWRDRSEMEGGENWWLQIEEAIRGVETMVLCLSEKALESPVVRKEWRTARQEGTRVIPVIASDVDFKKLPQWMTDVHWYDFRQKASSPEHQLQWERFVAQLKTPYEPKRVPFMVEYLPEGFVPRPDVLEPMVAALLDDERENPKAITTAIRGAGGYGKTTMARAICHDERIQLAFDDGILSVTLGETPDLITLVLDLVETLTGERPTVTGLDAAQTKLAEALADRDILLVIDDAWKPEDIKPFVQGGKRCARLITTRQRDTLPANTETPYELAEMKTTEATTLLGFGLPNAADQRDALIALAKRLYEYPLLLKLVNGTLRDLVKEFKQPLDQAIRDVNEALDQQAGSDWDSAVTRTLNVSLKQLDSDPSLRERFDQLAVFPEDIDIPLATIGKLWGTGALVTKNACMRFAKLSLLLDLNLERGTIRLHDVIRAYLRKGVDLAALDRKLLDTYQITEWYALPLDEPYLWDWLFAHLWGAGRTEELIRTALDLRYLANKTAARSTYAVEADLVMAEEIAPEDAMLRLLKRQCINMAHILRRCKSVKEVRETLHERLKHLEPLKANCAVLHGELTSPRLESWRELPDLPHPALIRVLIGHEGVVNSAVYSPDRMRLATASWDSTVRIWDASGGEMLFILKGHEGGVNSAAYSLDGTRLITASDDETARVWDANTGELLFILTGHEDWVHSAIHSPDEMHFVTASSDSTARVWDANNGTSLLILKGHNGGVNSAAYNLDGTRIVTASNDNTARVWDANTSVSLLILKGHTNAIYSAAYSPDGTRIVTASNDNTARVWDANTGVSLLILKGHTNAVYSAVYSPDGSCIVTGSHDNTMRAWNARTGELLFVIRGHERGINSVSYSSDGSYLVTTSHDETARVWDANSDISLLFLGEHEKWVHSVIYSPDGSGIVAILDTNTAQMWDANHGDLLFILGEHEGEVRNAAYNLDGTRLVTTSYTRMARVWDANNGELILILNGHESEVRNAAYSPNGKRIVTTSDDNILRIWDANSGELMSTFRGDQLLKAIYSPDGTQLVAVSRDNVVWVCDAQSGELLCTLSGHKEWIHSATYNPDGTRIVTASQDKTVRVWNASNGELLLTFSKHESSVFSAVFSPNGTYLVTALSDSTVQVWNALTGQALSTFYTDGSLTSVAWHPDGKHIVAGGAKGLYWLRLVE